MAQGEFYVFPRNRVKYLTSAVHEVQRMDANQLS